MSLVKDEEIALLAQGLTVLVEVFVADDQESIVVIDEIFYYFCDLIAWAQGYQGTELVSHPLCALSFPNF